MFNVGGEDSTTTLMTGYKEHATIILTVSV